MTPNTRSNHDCDADGCDANLIVLVRHEGTFILPISGIALGGRQLAFKTDWTNWTTFISLLARQVCIGDVHIRDAAIKGPKEREIRMGVGTPQPNSKELQRLLPILGNKARCFRLQVEKSFPMAGLLLPNSSASVHEMCLLKVGELSEKVAYHIDWEDRGTEKESMTLSYPDDSTSQPLRSGVVSHVLATYGNCPQSLSLEVDASKTPPEALLPSNSKASVGLFPFPNLQSLKLRNVPLSVASLIVSGLGSSTSGGLEKLTLWDCRKDITLSEFCGYLPQSLKILDIKWRDAGKESPGATVDDGNQVARHLRTDFWLPQMWRAESWLPRLEQLTLCIVYVP